MSKISKRPNTKAKSYLATILNVALGIGAVAVILSVLQVGSILFVAVVGAAIGIAFLYALALCMGVVSVLYDYMTNKDLRNGKRFYC